MAVSATITTAPTISSGTATVYPQSNWPYGTSIAGAPVGSSVTTGAVGTNGSVTFSGLTANTMYVAYQASPDRYVRFRAPAAAAVTSSASGVLLPSGRYVQVIPSTNNAAAVTLNREYLVGVMLAPQTIDRVAAAVLTAGSAGAVLRLGIRQDVDGTPGASAAEGTIDATVTGWQSITTSWAHPGGTLWFSLTGQGWSTTAPVIDSRTAGAAGPITAPLVPGSSLTTIGWVAGHTPVVGYQDGVSGALGATFTNVATTSQNLPSLILRRA